MAKHERLGPIFVLCAIAGALVNLQRASLLYGQGSIETATAVIYYAIFTLCILVIVRESILFLKDRGILP